MRDGVGSRARRTKQEGNICNEKCLFCDDAPESLEHMLACPAIVSRYSSEFKRIRQLIDPCDLLEGRLQWIQPQEKITQPLANLWKARLPYRRTEEKELQAMLSKIESHDKTAGMLGILPPRLHDVLLAYHRDSLKHAPRDSQLKSLRKEPVSRSTRYAVRSWTWHSVSGRNGAPESVNYSSPDDLSSSSNAGALPCRTRSGNVRRDVRGP